MEQIQKRKEIIEKEKKKYTYVEILLYSLFLFAASFTTVIVGKGPVIFNF